MKCGYGNKWSFFSVAFFLVFFAAVSTGILPAQSGSGLENQVRHALIMLPYYSIFDYLTFKVDGADVTLNGQVQRATLKSDAEFAVKQIPGVNNVRNEIEILPVSPNDDRIRLDVYRAIYQHSDFLSYALQAVPPIHIVVKNGNVTLYGPVKTQGDKMLANLQANGVSGVFSVTDNLVVSP